MRIEVNGEAKELAPKTTVRDLLVALGVETQLVAVERNHDIVPRAAHATTELSDGDRVEVVQFVGGG
jgi:thiamine biosynthesis protein ThiS